MKPKKKISLLWKKKAFGDRFNTIYSHQSLSGDILHFYSLAVEKGGGGKVKKPKSKHQILCSCREGKKESFSKMSFFMLSDLNRLFLFDKSFFKVTFKLKGI
jgi:hypothetical protein